LKPVIFHYDAGRDLLQSLARKIDCELGEVERPQFPDGESYVRLRTPVEDRDVMLLSSLDGPDAKTLPLLFAADAARNQGARCMGLVAPYLAYMRQDKAFQPGEAVTSATYARLLSDSFDWLVTIDPHMHRYGSLNAIYNIPSIATTAAEPIARWISGHVERPCLIGPDIESAQLVKKIATMANAPFAIFRKDRRGDFDVEIEDMTSSILANATLVIVDDIASSARTMVEAVRVLKARGRSDPICIVVHALFGGDAYQQLVDAGPAAIVSTNSVKHLSNAIDISGTLGMAVLEALKTTAASRLGD
jgi:ribose-phosphate pyrophosphokinase